MGLGEYASARAEIEFSNAERAREEWYVYTKAPLEQDLRSHPRVCLRREVENALEAEKAEMVELYVEKGMPEDDAVQVSAANCRGFCRDDVTPLGCGHHVAP